MYNFEFFETETVTEKMPVWVTVSKGREGLYTRAVVVHNKKNVYLRPYPYDQDFITIVWPNGTDFSPDYLEDDNEPANCL